jgi:hypothetical protein
VALQVLENLVPSITSLNGEMDDFNKTGEEVTKTAKIIATIIDVVKFSVTNLTYPLRTVIGLFSYLSDEFNSKMPKMEKFTGKYSYSDYLMSGHSSSTSGSGGRVQTTPLSGSGGRVQTTPLSGSGGRVQTTMSTDIDRRLRPGNNDDSGFGLAAAWIKEAEMQAAAIEKIIMETQKYTLSQQDTILGIDVERLSYLADYQKSAVDMWEKYYNDLEAMGTANFILMSDTTSQLFGGMGDMFISLTNQGEQQYRAMFEIGKAFKSAEIITSTYSAAVKAYESQVGIPIIGPYLAVAAAGSAIAFGVAQLANLWSTQPGQTSVSGGGAAPTPSFASRNPQTGGGSNTGTKNITIKFEGFIWDKDRLAREIMPALDRALSDGVRR